MSARAPEPSEASPAADDVAVPGRESFHASLRTESRRCARSFEPLSVLLVDVDGLDGTPGSPSRETAVRAMAEAMTHSGLRAGDVFAELGGRALGLVLPGVAESGALSVAERLVDVVGTLVVPALPGQGFRATVGCATSSHLDVSIDPATLLDRAGQALDTARASTHRRTVAYDDALDERSLLHSALAAALTTGELHLHYQPTVELRSGSVSGFEALMRWDRPGHGVLPPAEILAIAEGSTLGCELGRWALAEAVRQLASWSRSGLDPAGELRIAVNISARHVASASVLDDVRDALRGTGITPNQLEIEITERVPVDAGPAASHLRQLRASGVRVAIDDFGTGSTGIMQLPRLAVDSLKIDQSLIASHDQGIQSLVSVILDAARTFNLRVVAEGVEDDSTLLALRALGCDSAQGFVFTQPMPAEAVGPWLTAWRAAVAAGRWRRADDIQDRHGTIAR